MIDPRFTGGLARLDGLTDEVEVIVHSGGKAQRVTLGALQAALGVPDLLRLIADLEARVAALDAAP